VHAINNNFKFMTDKQINAAIAEACGWTKINVEHGSGLNPTNGLMMGVEFLPKYVKCLNAMHEAEATLSDDQLWRMAREIERNDEQWYFRATARQRAEAFLRTLYK
jgi:hypothetical protein